MKNTFALLFLLSALVQAVAPSNAIPQSQNSSAQVTGTITDPSGSAIAGAQIVAKAGGASSSQPVTTVSAFDGSYALTLPSGVSQLKFAHRSFTTRETSLTLAAGES